MAKLVVAALVLLAAAIVADAQCSQNFAALANCLPATQSATGYPGKTCCDDLTQFRGKPDCLCSTMLTAHKQFSFSVPNALSIPKRCGYTNEIPPNYKCGSYSVGH